MDTMWVIVLSALIAAPMIVGFKVLATPTKFWKRMLVIIIAFWIIVILLAIEFRPSID
jgi:hypothetical protein